MAGSEMYPRFADSVRLAKREENHLMFEVGGSGKVELRARSAGLADAMTGLIEGGKSESELAEMAGQTGGMEDAARFYLFLESFKKRQLVGYDWRFGGTVHAFLEPVAPDFKLSDVPLPVDADLTLSRFAYARQDDGRFVLESPDAPCRIELKTPWAVSWLGRLAVANPVDDDGFSAFSELLWRAGFAQETDREESNDRTTWEFHDRLLHTQSREGFSGRPLGGTYRFQDRFPPPPALKPPMSTDQIALEKPDMDQLAGQGESLSSVMERRRSVREFDDKTPVDLTQLSKILYRVARVREVIQNPVQEGMFRPFPSGGAIHELEFYLAVRTCDGLDRGLYHYQGNEHALYCLPAAEGDVDALIRDAAMAMGQPDNPPQCLVILASRLPRLAWKYEGIAYRLTLMNAGVIIQSLYLVATEMGVACSAIGTGNSSTFAAATGLDPLKETSVGEFALGSRA